MNEKYNGWTIVLDRGNNLSDLITKNFKFGKYGWVNIFIEDNCLKFVSSDPFFFNNVVLKSSDIYSKCNEADDVFRAEITRINHYLLELINQLPDI